MKFLDKLKSLEHTFVGYAVKTYQTVMKYEPQINEVATVGLKYVGGVVAEILRVEYGPVAGAAADAAVAEGQNILKEVHQDVTVAASLVYDAGANPTSAGMVQAAADNLSKLLAAGHIKSASSIALANKALASAKAVVDVLNPPAEVPAP